MSISTRIRKIREIRGWKQSAVAMSMNITQQAYSCLELGAGNARLETLKRFCDVMNVELPYLIAMDVPITQETLERYGQRKYNDFINTYARLEQKVEILNDMLSTRQGHSIASSNHISSSVLRA